MPMMAPVERPLEPELEPDAAALEEALAPDDAEEVEVGIEDVSLDVGLGQAEAAEHSVKAGVTPFSLRNPDVSESVSVTPSPIAK